MNLNFNTYTVESVTPGHPDKVCDQISDAILDECLKQDSLSRVAVEVFGSHNNFLVIGGEVTTKAKVNYANIASQVYKEAGYDNKLNIAVNVLEQSPEIAKGVDSGGAGDQGIMYGYATDETPEFMPKGVVLAHALARNLTEARKSGKVPWLKPDGKTQVTIRNGKIKTILVSTQHSKSISQKQLRKELIAKVIKPAVRNIENIEILTNPAGEWTQGGFEADTGLTGRKIMVDTYGGLIPHGGGCFSGKDATKVDRSGAYMCRFVARKLIEKKIAKKAIVSVAYAIGKAEPVMITAINEKGKDLSNYVVKNFDFRPKSIIKLLGLDRPIFRRLACFGHMTNF